MEYLAHLFVTSKKTEPRIHEFKVLHNIFGGLYSEQGKLKMFFEVVNDKLYTNFKGV